MKLKQKLKKPETLNINNKEKNIDIVVTKKAQHRIGFLHKIYLSQLKSSRKYTASTKTKSEVRGGGRKPWKQKGTGQARAGSIRSPLWVGGGVIFGPKPRIVFKKINKKEKRLAFDYAISLKLKAKKIYLITTSKENLNKYFCQFLDGCKIKTKEFLDLLLSYSINLNSKILIITTKSNIAFWLVSRNLKNIEVTNLNCVNLKQIINADHIFFMQTL